MKVRIVKYADGGGPKPRYTFKTHKGDKSSNWNASSLSDDELISAAEELGYNGPDNATAFQKWILANKDIPEIRAKIDAAHEKYGLPNAGKKADGYLGIRWNFLKPGKEADPIDAPNYNPNAFAQSTEEEKSNYLTPPGNNYSLKDSSSKKRPYQKQGLPFYQAIPELTGFASALNTYNYQTPDYQHYEIQPNKLNVQPQLQSIDSSLAAITATTTGNPQVDNARKVGAFTQALNAKQQVYANKQNYDAEKEFQATQFNINARTQEQNLDVNAMNHIYNEYMPLAKDAAAGERIAAISSLSTKYAKNTANENKKKLWLDNFYNNVEVDKDGNLKTTGNYGVNEEYYPTTLETPTPVSTLPAKSIAKPTKLVNPDAVIGPLTIPEIPTDIFNDPSILPSSIRKNRFSR